MDQLSLNIKQRLSYAPENFILHSGVKRLFSDCCGEIERCSFSVLFVEGGPRSGKSHFCIKLSQYAASKGLFPTLVDGVEFSSKLPEKEYRKDDVLIVDDADSYFRKLQPGKSGEFVSLIESLRPLGVGIVFLSKSAITDFPCDEHVTSRLLPGAGHRIGDPSDEELPELLRAMALQRGIALSEHKLQFVVKRVGRSISSMESYLYRLEHLSQVCGKSIKFPLISDALE